MKPATPFSEIKAIVFDIDGVLTDGGIILDYEGREIKKFHVRDGQLIKFMQYMGVVFGTISGRDCDPVKHRMKALGIEFVSLGQNNKQRAFDEFLYTFSLLADQVIYIGDDVIDIAILQQAGIAICPKDASDWVKPHCHIVANLEGGKGVLREVIDQMIVGRQWQGNLEDYFKYRI